MANRGKASARAAKAAPKGLTALGKPRKRAAGAGRPQHRPSDNSRKLVETLAGYGMPHEEIAALVPMRDAREGEDAPTLGIDDKTLRKFYRAELDTGALKAKAQTIGTLHRLANGSPAQFVGGNMVRAEQPVNVSALIFSCKARFGMRETVALAGDPNAPLNIRMADLTDAQLDELEKRLSRKSVGSGPG